MSEDKKLKGWKEIPLGGIIDEPATSLKYKTGDWRTFRPVHIREKCINCMICWVFCPEGCIKPEIKDGKGNFGHFDYDYCKECGLCEKNCPVKAIEMKPETEFK